MKHRLVFATNNDHKLKEIGKLMPAGFEILGMKDIGCMADIEENADTLEGNADIKASFIYEHFSTDCFADDTGLEVECLGGEPGVFSARYAGEDGNADKNIDKLLANMQGEKNRKARFRTVITLIMNAKFIRFEGIVNGNIIEERRGHDGFGYDPVFIPDGYDKTFSEMPLDLKNTISHRGRATRKLIEYLQGI